MCSKPGDKLEETQHSLILMYSEPCDNYEETQHADWNQHRISRSRNERENSGQAKQKPEFWPVKVFVPDNLSPSFCSNPRPCRTNARRGSSLTTYHRFSSPFSTFPVQASARVWELWQGVQNTANRHCMGWKCNKCVREESYCMDIRRFQMKWRPLLSNQNMRSSMVKWYTSSASFTFEGTSTTTNSLISLVTCETLSSLEDLFSRLHFSHSFNILAEVLADFFFIY